MKLFLKLKHYFAVIDIRSNQKHLFSLTNLSASFIVAYAFGAISTYMIYEDNSIIDLANLFYGSTTYFLNFITLFSNIIKQKKFFEFIDKLEAVIGNSEQNLVDLEF